VHDLVDFVSEEAEIAGKAAADYICGRRSAEPACISIRADGKIRYTVPQRITEKKDVRVYFRVSGVFRNVSINVYSNGEKIFSKKRPRVAPGEMESITLEASLLENTETLEFKLEEN